MLKGIDFECALAMNGYRLADARMSIIIAIRVVTQATIKR